MRYLQTSFHAIALSLSLAGGFDCWLECAAVYARRSLLLAMLLVVAAAPAFAQTPPRPPALSAEAVLLLDPDGRTIFARNAARIQRSLNCMA